MGVVYSKTIEVTVTGEEDNCVELPTPPRGILRRLVVKQTTGEMKGFELDIYSRGAACPGWSGTEDCVDEDPLLEPITYKITDTLTAGGSSAEEVYDAVYPYENQDPHCQKIRNSRLYMRLEPGGDGSLTFSIGYSITADLM